MNESESKRKQIRKFNKEVVTLVGLSLVLLILITALSVFLYETAQSEKQAVEIIPVNGTGIYNLIFPPHALTSKEVNVTTLSAMYCYIEANTSGLDLFVMNQQQYSNFTNHALVGALAETPPNSSVIEIHGNLHFTPGTYYIVIWNPNNYTVKATLSTSCEIRPIG
jgi:hypothetical protein